MLKRPLLIVASDRKMMTSDVPDEVIDDVAVILQKVPSCAAVSGKVDRPVSFAAAPLYSVTLSKAQLGCPSSDKSWNLTDITCGKT